MYPTILAFAASVSVVALFAVLGVKTLSFDTHTRLRLKFAVILNTTFVILTGALTSGCSKPIIACYHPWEPEPDNPYEDRNVPPAPPQHIHQSDSEDDG
ncbi:MAG: hypothetical protein JSW52_00685 [Candidatus Coatesbacteria bacterium]|nr:MAG: hypothetical protein JSW52_00685 [Candidatus Coatesbacteria bacterium]